MENPENSPAFSTLTSAGVESPSPWYAIRTFNCQELKVSEFLSEKGKEHFIPMTYVERHTRQGKAKRVLAPVVHNMVFVRKDDSERHMSRLFSECTVPLYILRKEGTPDYYEIPDGTLHTSYSRRHLYSTLSGNSDLVENDYIQHIEAVERTRCCSDLDDR